MELIVNKRIGEIEFNMSEPQIINILGYPDRRVEHFDDDYKTIELQYNNKDITIFLDLENFKLLNLSIHLNKCFLGNSEIYVNQDYNVEVINVIKNFHKSNNIRYIKEVDLNIDIDRMYNYPNIGLTLWVEDGKINDIQVEALSSY